MNLAQIFAENRNRVIKQNTNIETKKIQSKIDKIESTDLLTIKGIWESTVKILLENWISSQDELIQAWVNRIKELKLNPFSTKAIKEFLQSK